MCDSVNYPNFCNDTNPPGCTPTVDGALNNNPSLGLEHRSSLETAFLNGCYGEDNSNCLIPEGYESVWGDVNAAGVTWRGQNPSKPRPPLP